MKVFPLITFPIVLFSIMCCLSSSRCDYACLDILDCCDPGFPQGGLIVLPGGYE